ncbi:SCO7613 C-terminal domain-containing membrane protein [Nocardioides sp.]|uniref:SCO7613 C-terminal domain-containing membrane protein n=1 Tax=Nocardioides sp. TaxID=35761 RepID=UPI0035199483
MSLPPTGAVLPTSRTAGTGLGCPQCGVPLPGVVEACGSCGIRLTGPRAIRLWQVDQQLVRLTSERARLIEELMRPVAAAGVPGRPGVPPPPPGPVPGPGRAPRRTGQQLLLGLGAVMLLSAAAFFVAVLWLLVGVVGQALIMAGLTAAAVGGSVLAVRARLTATAETAAVIAVGLLAIDVSAAWSLGLAGLDRLAFATYACVALPVCAVLLVLAHVVSRRAPQSPQTWCGPSTYLPAAAVSLLGAGLALIDAVDLQRLGLLALVLTVAAALGAVALAARTLLPRLPLTPAAGPGSGPARASLGLLITGVLGALGLAALVALHLTYALTGPLLDRYVAAGALVLLAVALLLSTRVVPGSRALAVVGAVVATALAVGSPLLDLPSIAVVVLATLAAVALAGLALGVPSTGPGVDRLAGALAGIAAAGAGGAALLSTTGNDTGRELLRRVADSRVTGSDGPLPLLLLGLPVLALLVAAVLMVVRRRRGGWVAVATLTLLWATVLLSSDADAATRVVVHLGVLVLTAALAVLAAHRAPRAAAPAVPTVPTVPTGPTVPRLAPRLDLAGVLASSALGILALGHAVATESAGWPAAVFALCGVVTVVYAGAPGRLPMAYLGSLLLSASSMVLLADGGVAVVEAYSLPLAVMLGMIGVVQHVRGVSAGRIPSTQLTLAPALGVALMPSTMLAIAAGGEVRLAVVTLVAVALTVGGALAHLRAPTLVGGIAVVLVALTQGGPLIAYVPGWMTLGLGGAVLLVAGVLWEQALAAGRATGRWIGAMR